MYGMKIDNASGAMEAARNLEGKSATDIARALLNAHYEGLSQAMGKGVKEINKRRIFVAGQIDGLQAPEEKVL